MNPVIVRNVEIGTGIPKICVPLIGRTKVEILQMAKDVLPLDVDFVEWRGDWYEDILDFEKTIEVLRELREVLQELPLLFTFRTTKEGGEKEIMLEDYLALNQKAIASGYLDLIDVELFCGENIVKSVIEAAHLQDVKVIVSNHDFQQTPTQKEIVSRLYQMQMLGADILKMAVMPLNTKDVLILLSATEEMTSTGGIGPVITMAMGELGVISRLSGAVFGSAVTFGAAQKSSAPGQIEIKKLRTILEVISVPDQNHHHQPK